MGSSDSTMRVLSFYNPGVWEGAREMFSKEPESFSGEGKEKKKKKIFAEVKACQVFEFH